MTLRKIKNLATGSSETLNYNEWFLTKHLPKKEELEDQKNYKFKYLPKISIVTPTYNTPKQFLVEMIESVRNQTYSNWELCLADGASTNKDTIKILKEYERKDDRIKVKYLDKNLMISGNTNEALTLTTGDYIGLFDHDDLLTPNCLFEVVKVLNENKDIKFIYTDEDKTNEKTNEFFEAHFKPDWSPDTLRSYNYICHFTVIKKEIIDKIGRFRSKCDGSQDHDLFLRATEIISEKEIKHISKVLYHWRVHQNSTAASAGTKTYTMDASIRALNDHLERKKISGYATNGFFPNSYKLNYSINVNPVVSILIANKDHKEDLKKCIDSILKKTTYENFEIIVIENNSDTKEIFEYYDEISKNKKIKVVKWLEKGFNYSAINNFGFKYSTGDYIVLLNNDIEIITKNWIEEMLMYCQRSDVGAVGAKLYYPDDTIQHAGVILGYKMLAGHAHLNKDRNNPSYFGRAQVVQNLSAVTAACMMIKRDIYEEIDGLDEKFKVAFNDIDLCMKIREKDYLIVWTPFAEAYHHESKSRGNEDTPEKIERFNGEIKRFEEKWGLWLKDPYYNENLSLEREDFSLKF